MVFDVYSDVLLASIDFLCKFIGSNLTLSIVDVYGVGDGFRDVV